MTKHDLLKRGAAVALSNIDKDTAIRLAGSVASTIASRPGHTGVRLVAGLVAHGLAAADQRRAESTTL